MVAFYIQKRIITTSKSFVGVIVKIIAVPEWVDFRDDLVGRTLNTKTFIKTPIPQIVLRVTKLYDSFLVSIEDINHPEEITYDNYRERVMGIVNLIEKYEYVGLTKVFEPHSFLDERYRGNKYVETIYRWILDNGFTLVSGKNQTKYSNGLWKKLSKDYEFNLYDIFQGRILNEGEDYDVSDDSVRLMLRRKNVA